MHGAILAGVLVASMAYKVECRSSSSMVHDFDRIKPSADLTWTPCFDNFTCTRLQVPLDYEDKSRGMTSIGFIKLAGKNATTESQSIVIIPGGPGGSGVEILTGAQDGLGQILGESYNFVSFDPRGVGASGPKIDCFSGNKKAREAFARLHYSSTTNTSSTSLAEQYYSGSIYGEWCNNAVKHNSSDGYYVSTPAVAHDLLTFVEAEAKMKGKSPSKAKFWGYAISYGTVIGTTFASMFPERVERMALESVLNTDWYYSNDWESGLVDADKVVESFSTFCHAAGPQKCSFWGKTPANITARLDGFIKQLQSHPVPISGIQGKTMPTMVTYSDIKALLAKAVYEPLANFPSMADVLHQLEGGNATGLVGTFDSLSSFTDDGVVTRCVDSYGENKFATLDGAKSTVQCGVSRSKYLGDVFPIYSRSFMCTSVKPKLPKSMMIQGQVGKPNKKTFFPILFTGNTLDPVAPVVSAKIMSSRFPGSKVLLQEAVGHIVILQSGSRCYFEHLQAYFQGVMPPSNITCSQEAFPFIDKPLIQF
ncbi:putative hydrolase [Fusarium austroafricanum]|uniref:Putative hydrolase n=1 Tax=Fusarium austroafricanum TaxID=2364996 RepID=A0A8H4JYG6_9HYPO|nr:putative hydrolase [Fusarium austroafricanum]